MNREEIGNRHGIWIMGHMACTVFRPPASANLIRIASVTDEDGRDYHVFRRLVYPELYGAILLLNFDDFGGVGGGLGHGAITSAQAAEVVSFFESLSESSPLVIHCWAGVSRSAAVGLAYCYFRGNRDAFADIAASEDFAPNAGVFELIKAEIDSRTDSGMGPAIEEWLDVAKGN